MPVSSRWPAPGEFYRTLGPERLYQVQEDPQGVVRLAPGAPKDEAYDASFEVDQVRRGYDLAPDKRRCA